MNTGQLWFCTLLLGPSVGSFCGMLLTRLPRRASSLLPGSHCFTCGHPLAVGDLVPLLSFLWLHGRCRYCRSAIPHLHLSAELSCTLVACLGAALGAWWGLLGAMLLAVAICTVAGLLLPPLPSTSQRGSTLLEVAVAAALLALVLVPAFGLFSVAGASIDSTRRHATATGLALAKIEECRSLGYDALLTQKGGGGGVCLGTEDNMPGWPGFSRSTSLQSLDPSWSVAGALLVRVTVQSTGKRTQVITLQTLVGREG